MRLMIIVLTILSWSSPLMAQDLLPTLQRIRAEYPTPMSPAQIGEYLNRVAWEHCMEGWGLLRKDAGSRCPAPQGVSISCDILIGGPGNPPHHFDVLIDAGGASIPTWSDVGPCQLGPSSGCDMSRFLLPIPPPGFVNPLPPVLPLNITGDVFKELLFYNRTTGSFSFQLGTAQNSFTPGATGGWLAGFDVHRADFNGDQLDDLFLYSPTSGLWFKVINNAATGFTYFTQGWLPGFKVYILDLNADARADVFLYNPATGLWVACTSVGDGTGGFSYASGGWAAGWDLFLADFDGDARTDLLLTILGLAPSAKRSHAGARASSRIRVEGGPQAGSPFIVELNGDGRHDVFLYNVRNGTFVRSTSTGDGTGGFTYVAGGWLPGWQVQVADFDGNGRSDLFIYEAAGGWYKVINTGTGFMYFGGGWRHWETLVTDLNSDGKSDVFLYDPASRVWVQAITTTPDAFIYTSGTF